MVLFYRLLFLVTFIGHSAFAQSTFTKHHTLDLSKQTLPDLPKSFYIDKVFDSRLVKQSVGEVQLGILNSKASAVFNTPLEQELQQFISFHHPKQENQKPVILRINKLWISENTTLNSETGSTELLVDFIYQQDSIFYKVYSASNITTYQGLDVTKKHEQKIAQALMECMSKFAVQDFEKLLASAEVLAPEQVNATYSKETVVQNYPILQATNFTKGIYQTLDEFRNNAPSFTTGYELKEQVRGRLMPVATTEDGKKKNIKAAWGFTDGNNLFINYGGVYYPLSFADNQFTFIGPPIPGQGTGAIVAGGVVGGMIGGAIAGGIVAATAKPAEYSLDLVTGAILQGGKPVGMNTDDAMLILYRGTKGEKEQAVRILLNGQEHVILPNAFLEMKLSTTDGGTSICPGTAKDKCLNFMPIPGKTYYISSSLAAKSVTDLPELKVEDEATGAYDLRGIKFTQEKANKKASKK